jgi:hypothetical protein
VRALRLLAVAAGLVALAVTAGSSRAERQSAPVPATAIAAGLAHTCVLTKPGGVKCWGYNGHDELGNEQVATSLTPVPVSGLAQGVASISAGVRHSCALLSTGGVKCWGYNRGALGDGTVERRRVPVDVIGLSGSVTAVVAGNDASCVLTAAGGVECWGPNRLSPVAVPGLSAGAKAIAAGPGFSRTCALTTAGAVECWGGDLVPKDVSGLRGGVTAITSSCALTGTGGVQCWDKDLVASDVPGLGSVKAISSSFHSCALLASGGVKCWGVNQYGELGDGTTFDRSTPGDVVGLHGPAVGISAGSFSTCAVLRSGAVDCWGLESTQSPDAVVAHLRPVAVPGFGIAKATVAIVSGAIRVTRDRVVAVHLRCGTATRCRGTLTLKSSHTTLGSRSLSIPAGATRAVDVRLTRSGYEKVLRAKRLVARVVVTGAVSASRKVTLAAP